MATQWRSMATRQRFVTGQWLCDTAAALRDNQSRFVMGQWRPGRGVPGAPHRPAYSAAKRSISSSNVRTGTPVPPFDRYPVGSPEW